MALFEEPGEYSIRVSIGGGQLDRDNVYGLRATRGLTTSEVSVTIIEPSTDEESRIAKLMVRPDVASMMQYMRIGQESEARIGVLKTIAESQTAYASYAAYVLALTELHRELRSPPNATFVESIGMRRARADLVLDYIQRAEDDGYPLKGQLLWVRLHALRKRAHLADLPRYQRGEGGREVMLIVQMWYPDLWDRAAEVGQLEERILAEFPETLGAIRIRTEREYESRPNTDHE